MYYLTESLKYIVSLHLKQWKVAARYLNTSENRLSVGLWLEILQEAVDIVPLGLRPLHLQRERAVRLWSAHHLSAASAVTRPRVQGSWTRSALGST